MSTANDNNNVQSQSIGEDDDNTNSSSDLKGGLNLRKKAVIIGIAIGFIGAGFLLFYVLKTGLNRADFILSNTEITDFDDTDSIETINAGDRIYFSLKHKKTPLNADDFVLIIEKKNNGEYTSYKKITYEIEKTFPRINSYIPREYFSVKGGYRIRALLDGNEVAAGEFTVTDQQP
ncbi:MAG TPA: hypothetical protein PK926_05215 [Spirochaetota bacterium]|nr:hypothetical protein [Spirochaetota bacterium]HPI88137.1 hypothetical protein [Spirochaetota bacterium]HPR47912.1 hypothetical protein [Spirochaetota bacterium]